MSSKYNYVKIVMIHLIFFSVTKGQSIDADEQLFPGFADDNTVVLWLFDETQYPFTTVTDASTNEYDLRLQQGGLLLPGKFGKALSIVTGSEYSVSYAGFKGAVSMDDRLRGKNGVPSGLWGPTIVPEKILTTLSNNEWTIELWIKLKTLQNKEAVIIDLGNAHEPGFKINLLPDAGGFIIENAYAGYKAEVLNKAANFSMHQWHHIVFISNDKLNTIQYFFDGILQRKAKTSAIKKVPLPPVILPKQRDHSTFGFTLDKQNNWCRANRFNISLGQTRQAQKSLDGMLDELRLSSVIRYDENFDLPQSFSRNYGSHATKPTEATGPPLLLVQEGKKTLSILVQGNMFLLMIFLSPINKILNCNVIHLLVEKI